MPAWPDASLVSAALTRAARRLTFIAAMRAAAAGLAVAAILIVIGARLAWPTASRVLVAVAPVALAVVVAVWRARSTPTRVALRLEARAPHFRNIVVTAAEIMAAPSGVNNEVGARVCRDAAVHLARTPLAALLPWRRDLLLLTASVILTAAAGAVAARHPSERRAAPIDPHAATLAAVQVIITPPAYAGLPAQTLLDPATISVLAGSTIDVAARAEATTVSLQTIAAKAVLTGEAGTFRGRVSATEDGFLALQPIAADGVAGARRLIGVTVTPDRSPTVRITAPGRDLLFQDGHQRLQLAVDASDDLALDRLTLAYTKASGSGENFDFTRGEVPLTVTRSDPKHWTATATWSLDALALEPGDFVVYHGVAADRRPGMTPSESDVFMVEIVAPGSVAADGFAIADDQDRYALSQRMVIVKTERLLARKSTMSAEAFDDEAQGIAAEQRHVRAEFIFMMGGELEAAPIDSADNLNEEVEAAGEGDLLAGRARNQGRIDLLTATRRMSEAATLLTTLDATRALVAEKAALDSLQKAFSKSRYLLRALATREGLDMARRLSGSLTGVASDRRPAVVADDNPRMTTMRVALAEIAGLAGRATYGAEDAAGAVSLAERLLRLDATSTALRQMSTDLAAAAAAITAGRGNDVRPTLDRVSIALVAAIRADLPPLPSSSPATGINSLRGALADAQRRRGGR